MNLQAVDQARNIRRRYFLAVERDLLGDWIVRANYGRLGTTGRTIVTVVQSEDEARELARSILRRRATAPKRIGIAYRKTEETVAVGWRDLSALIG